MTPGTSGPDGAAGALGEPAGIAILPDRNAVKGSQYRPMPQPVSSERTVFLSTLPASRRERRSATVVGLVFLALFALAAPFAQVKLAEVWAFIPSYQSALLVNDLPLPSCSVARAAVFLTAVLIVSVWCRTCRLQPCW